MEQTVISTSNRYRKTGIRVGLAGTAVVFALAAVAACGGGGNAGSAAGDSGAARSSAGSHTGEADTSKLDALTANMPHGHGSAAHEAKSAVLERQVISTGDITLASSHVARTRTAIMHAVARLHGRIADEETSADRNGHVRSVRLTLRVPSARFDEAMSDVAALAHATHQTRTARDVTTRVIDTDARVRAKERAVAQLERLLDRADTLGQVIRLEGDISQRQAELNSLKHQQAYLEDQTSMSTITVDLTRRATASSATHDAGLLPGLRAGAHAFVVALVWLLTVVGAVAPFAAVLAVIGVPVWLLRRRRRSAPVDVVDQAG